MAEIDIDSLEPGRELDAMVWQALNGQEVNIVKCRYVDGDWQPHAGYPSGHISPPHYSTEMAAAWEVVERMCAAQYNWMMISRYMQEFTATFVSLENPHLDDCVCNAPTAPHAICLAALRVVQAGQLTAVMEGK